MTALEPKDAWWRRLSPDSLSHDCPDWRVLETHISVIVLTGPWAYKFKKQVDFGFLDYSTLEKRRSCCERELECNVRYSQGLYDGVVKVIDQDGALHVVPIDSHPMPDVDVVDYGVRMRQFPQTALLSQQLEAGLPASNMDALARRLADWHRDWPASTGTRADFLNATEHWMRENFEHFDQHLNEPQRLDAIRQWSERQWESLAERMHRRWEIGRIKQCHGDLHLDNVLFWHDQFQLFDGIEFNRQLSEIDVANDLAFLLMELSEQGYRRHARRLLSSYLEQSHDYQAIDVMRFYLVYRALVRAKVNLIRQQQTSGLERTDFSEEGTAFLEFADRITTGGTPSLYLMHGVSGSGKSTVAMQMVEQMGVIRLRSDWVRKKLKGQADPDQKTAPEDLPQMYSKQSTEQTYQWLRTTAEQILQAGYSVVVDATFLERWQRQPFQQTADSNGVPFHLVTCGAARSELEQRLRDRGPDPSDATIEVLDQQFEKQDPIQECEESFVIPASQLVSLK